MNHTIYLNPEHDQYVAKQKGKNYSQKIATIIKKNIGEQK
jgi:hypothetical protein